MIRLFLLALGMALNWWDMFGFQALVKWIDTLSVPQLAKHHCLPCAGQGLWTAWELSKSETLNNMWMWSTLPFGPRLVETDPVAPESCMRHTHYRDSNQISPPPHPPPPPHPQTSLSAVFSFDGSLSVLYFALFSLLTNWNSFRHHDFESHPQDNPLPIITVKDTCKCKSYFITGISLLVLFLRQSFTLLHQSPQKALLSYSPPLEQLVNKLFLMG